MKEALDITNDYFNLFRGHCALLNRDESKRLSTLYELIKELVSGLLFKSNIDDCFRQYTELNNRLKEFKSELPETYLIVFIVNNPLQDYLQAKISMGLRDDITLKEGKSIVE